MSPETLLTWAELRAALADPETLWLLGDARPLWLIPVLALLAVGLPADRALAARGRNLAALSLRLVTLSLLLFAVAQPRIQRRVPDLAVVIAEDRSASMSPARLDDARALAARIRAGLPEGVPVVEVFDAPAEATDLTALLQRAVAAAPSARTRRVLLLTDGADRHGGAEGDAAARAAALAGASGVQLYPVPPGLPAPNGAVTGLVVPDGLLGGTSAQAEVTLHLTEPAQGALTLTVASVERARRDALERRGEPGPARQHLVGAELPHELALRVARHRADDPRPRLARELHEELTCASRRAVDQHRVVRRDAPERVQHVPRRERLHRERRRAQEVEPRGDGDELLDRHHAQLGVRPRGGEGDARVEPAPVDAGAQRSDDARALEARRLGQRLARQVQPAPPLGVREVEAAGVHLDQHFPGGWARRLELLDLQHVRTTEG